MHWQGSVDDEGNGVPPNATVVFDIKLVRIGSRQRGHEASSDEDDDEHELMPVPSAFRKKQKSNKPIRDEDKKEAGKGGKTGKGAKGGKKSKGKGYGKGGARAGKGGEDGGRGTVEF